MFQFQYGPACAAESRGPWSIDPAPVRTHTYIQCTRTQVTAGTPAHWPAPVIADANAAW